jgi:LDH2 family malate/lactate/ureidoglycolate dehydrogenase
MSEQLVLTAAHAESLAQQTLSVAGWDDEDATLITEVLVETSLRGIDSHGVVALLPFYASLAPASAGGAEPTVVHEAGAVAVVDGHGGLGLRTAREAIALARERAGQSGVGVVAARGVGYLGSLWWCVEPPARKGAVALVCCTGQACVAPHGGRESLHGTNPLAVAVPNKPNPIVVDMRTNALRMADYREKLRTGTSLPEGALIDGAGRPVTDPHLVDAAVYLPLAGAKGYALALVVDVLAAALSGAPIGRELDASNEQAGVGAFFLILEPAFFGSLECFHAAVRCLSDQARATEPLDPANPVRLPGERSQSERRRRLADGIPVHRADWERMRTDLTELGIDVNEEVSQ